MRDDLLALSDESLAVLANVGLVKRAQKDIAAGSGPSIDEEADGTVVAASRDGATTRLAPGAPLKQTQCTCGATTVCRHRVSAVLAYRQKHVAAEPSPVGGASWDPGAVSDEELRATCGHAFGRAAALGKQSCLVTVLPGRAGAPPQARLPTATVLFLVPNSAAFAKCDCVAGGACEHVVIAVWAFRAAPAEGGTVELGRAEVDDAFERALPHVLGAIEAAARGGIGDVSVAHDLSRGRAAAEDAGWVWVADALEELERQADAYARQSTRFSARRTASLLAEILARVRSARHGTALPAHFLLGADEARETLMEQVRLISLGASLEADGERRFATVYFANPDGKQVLVLRKEWRFAEGAAKNGAELGALYASSRMSLLALAQGELVTRAAKRRANGEIDLAHARGMKSSLLPGGHGWDELREPLLLRDVERKAQWERSAPPELLRPRRIGADVHVVAIGKVIDVTWARAAQTLSAVFEDQAKHRICLSVPHRTVSPGAIDAWAEALGAAPRLISGHLSRTRWGWQLVPLGVVTSRFVVPALARPAPEMRHLPEEEELDPDGTETLSELFAGLEECVARGVVKGARAVARDAAQLARDLAEVGMPRLSAVLSGLAEPADEPAERALLDACLLATLLASEVP